jgi:hypothetical protein
MTSVKKIVDSSYFSNSVFRFVCASRINAWQFAHDLHCFGIHKFHLPIITTNMFYLILLLFYYLQKHRSYNLSDR